MVKCVFFFVMRRSLMPTDAPDAESIVSINRPLLPVLTAYPPCRFDQIWPQSADESAQVHWLIACFNQCFADQHTRLVWGGDEPEYLPAQGSQPAQIQFAHGYFASALHEISHWCIAGPARRQQADLGYWYAPDGRTREQQALFEQVEIKPQALEWLFTVACGRPFRVSLDNLNGDAGDGQAFKDAVHARVMALLSDQAPVPADAQRLLAYLLANIRPTQPVQWSEFDRALI
jgi:elongation factor P hydroxylase